MRRRLPDRSHHRRLIVLPDDRAGAAEGIFHEPAALGRSFFFMPARRCGHPRPAFRTAAAVFLTLAATVANAENPLIKRLDPSDAMFVQYLADVEDARKLIAAYAGEERSAASLSVYEYRPSRGEELITIAARCGIPYETVATINRFPSPDFLESGAALLLPSVPGLFIPLEAESDLERLMAAARENDGGIVVTVRSRGGATRFRFRPGAEFSGTERAFFLNAAFRFPLPAGRVTSGFGLRRNPVTGNLGIHAGLDLAASEGTEVFAARSGTVSAIGEDPVLGRYVIVSHEAGWKSVYGHLSTVKTDLRNEVRSGTLLGQVGSTGQSTGPHLHFELRRNGEAHDPAPLIPRGPER